VRLAAFAFAVALADAIADKLATIMALSNCAATPRTWHSVAVDRLPAVVGA
jgi:hypothetical protein